MTDKQKSPLCLSSWFLYVTRSTESALMFLYLQISFPLPKAYTSIPSNCGVLYVLFWYHLDRAERGLHCELALERGGGGKKTTPYLIVTKKALECSRNLITMVVRGLGSRKGI